MHRNFRSTALVLGLIAMSAALPAAADDAPFKGKNIVVAAHVNVGTYAEYAQLVADHLGRHLPGAPTSSFQIIPGAGGLTATNHLYNLAPKDGTHLLMVVQTFAMDQILGSPGVRYDARRFNIIGRLSDNTSVALGWKPAGLTSTDALKDREVTAGGTGSASPTDIFPAILNASAQTRFRVITGYASLNEILLAMQRGEVQSVVTSLASLDSIFASVVKEGLAVPLVQFSLHRHATLPKVATASELASTDEGRELVALIAGGSELGRLLIAPPGTPKDRLDHLRRALQEMVTDPLFLADAAKRKLPISYSGQAEMVSVVDDAFKTSASTIKRAADIMRVK